jgi:hypothetical protein
MHPEQAQFPRNHVFDQAQCGGKAALMARNSRQKSFTNNGV